MSNNETLDVINSKINDIVNDLVEVTLKDKESFLKIKETLQRVRNSIS